MERIEFYELCDYALLDRGYPARAKEEKSRAKDMTGQILNLFGSNYLVLYEGERRILRGHDKPEVCWICVSEDGKVTSIAARHLRKGTPVSGFALWEDFRNLMLKKRKERYSEWLLI